MSTRRPLLAIDGDSLAHRAYHALPKSIRLNAVVGFSNFVLRLWESERPRAILAAWDTLSSRPTATRRSRPTSRGASSRTRSSSSSSCCHRSSRRWGSPVPRAPATRRTTSSRPRRRWPAAGASRDLRPRRLPARRATGHDPAAGQGRLGAARIGPAEVRERYDCEPEQVPDLIALRGDPSDRIPGAHGVGPKTAATCCASTARSRRRSQPGRFAAEADALRLYKRIATMDAAAPLPPLPDQEPTWERAAALAREWQLNGSPTGWRRCRLVSHPSLGWLHPTGTHPERGERIDALLERLPVDVEAAPATRADVERCHDPAYVSRVQDTHDDRAGSTRTRSAPRRRYEAALLAAGAAIQAAELGGFALARPPGHHALPGALDGLLPLRLGRGRRALGAGRRTVSSVWRSSTGTSTTATGRRRSSPATTRCCSSRCTSGRSTPAAADPTSRGDAPERAAAGGLRRPRVPGGFRGPRRAGGARASSPSCCSSRRASTPTPTTRSPTCASPRTASASSRAARPRSRRASPRCWRAATTSRRCPTLVEAALEGFGGYVSN